MRKSESPLSPENKQQMINFIKGLDEFFKSIPGPPEDLTLRKQIMDAQKNKKVFDRSAYYSQTECCAKYDLTPKKFQQICGDHGIHQVRKDVDMGGWSLTTRYVLKADFDKINFV